VRDESRTRSASSMNATAIALIVFVCAFGGALLGMFLRRVLPEAH